MSNIRVEMGDTSDESPYQPRKFRKVDFQSNSTSDDDVSLAAGSQESPRIFNSRSTSYDDFNDIKQKKDSDGLSILLEALLRSEGPLKSVEVSGNTDNENGDVSPSDRLRSPSPFLSDSDRWSMMFTALEEYGRIHGHCNPPISYECTVRGGAVRLGTWLSTQRQLKRKNNLRPDREMQLQGLVDSGLLQWSIPSIASPDDEKWTLMYSSLLKYGQVHGHCNVPYSHSCTLVDGSLVKLGAWLRKQREQKKKGSLRPDRDENLAILVNANILRMPSQQATEDDQWATMMDALEGYGAKHGHCNVSQCHKYKLEDGSVVWLGAWLQKQRELRRKGILKPDRLDQLQALVEENMLLWDPPCHTPSDDEKWDIMLDALNRYASQYGHCNLSAGQEYTIDDGSSVKLGAWLSQQRHHKKKGKLRADREAKLQLLVDEGKLFWGMRGKLENNARGSSPPSSLSSTIFSTPV